MYGDDEDELKKPDIINYPPWMNFVRSRYDKLKEEREYLTNNHFVARNRFAEWGMECTPDEMKNFLLLMNRSLEIVESERENDEERDC